MWREKGPGMVDAVGQVTGKPFTPPDQVHLTLCDVRSNAFHGITVNMRYALEGFTTSPVPLRYKMDTVFHEMLHEFVRRNTPRASALLAASAREDRCVRNHLHLLSLQKAVLLSTGQADAHAQVIANDALLPSGCYRRAWKIVNATPGAYEAFVAELAH